MKCYSIGRVKASSTQTVLCCANTLSQLGLHTRDLYLQCIRRNVLIHVETFKEWRMARNVGKERGREGGGGEGGRGGGGDVNHWADQGFTWLAIMQVMKGILLCICTKYRLWAYHVTQVYNYRKSNTGAP